MNMPVAFEVVGVLLISFSRARVSCPKVASLLARYGGVTVNCAG